MNQTDEFTVFAAETGLIIRHLCMRLEFVQDQLGAGEDFIPGHFDAATQRIDRGTRLPVDYQKPPAAPPAVEQLRLAAYPDMRDQLDALWKGGTAMVDMRALVLAVKAKFPKSGEPK